MTATSLKLPEQLKHRIERLAASACKSPHAFMVETLAREADRAELRERFAAEADQSEKQAMASGNTFDLAGVFDYLDARVSGKKARRPRAREWRASK